MRIGQTARQEHSPTCAPLPSPSGSCDRALPICRIQPGANPRWKAHYGPSLVFPSNDTESLSIASQAVYHALLYLVRVNIGSISRDRFIQRGLFWNMDDACIQLNLERKSAWPAHHQTRLIRLSTCEPIYKSCRGRPQEASQSASLAIKTCTAGTGRSASTSCRQ